MAYRVGENLMFDEDFGDLIAGESHSGDLDKEGVIPDEISILPLKNTVLFPGVMIPITVGRDKSIQLVKDANRTSDKLIGVISQKSTDTENPSKEDLFTVGTIARLHKLFKMPDGSITIVIQGKSRFHLDEYVQEKPYFKAKISPIPEKKPSAKETNALMISLKQEANRIIELSPGIPSEARITIQNISNLRFLANFIASNLGIDVDEKQRILEVSSLVERAELVLFFMSKELAVLELSEEIQSKVRSDLDSQQREYFLRQQIKAIQDELGDEGADMDSENFRERAALKKWPPNVKTAFEKELKKLSRLSPNMPDYGIVINYLEWLLDLPWAEYTTTQIDLSSVKRTLDEDHYGLEKVKDRILEHLAVLKLKADKKSPIICFYGPPGVGKTSLGKSIARAMGREFVRISLGGVKDEAEIRGHRRTYIGAMPGRIIQGLKKTHKSDPVFMLDEIDKVGNDFRGDPSSALLEVLDPEQNNSFADHFLEVEYDLSRILFIATANNLSTIHPALRDRMEIIEINGYSMEEKIEIAKNYLIPTLRKDHGLKVNQFKVAETTIQKIIEGYTRESGVRNLQQQISALCRFAAKEIVLNNQTSLSVNSKNLADILGIARFESEQYQKSDRPGVAIGLAWTSVGGDILFIETALIKGTGKLTLTGQLGDVMKESAQLAYHFIRAHADLLGIPFQVFKNWDIHVHFPAGSVPKDGPSAGITILTALASIFTQRLIVPGLAMTGEITLRGKVLPVGGIKEKVLAARRAGIKTILMCKENRKDVMEIKADYIKDLEFIYVEEMMEVLGNALQKSKVRNALSLLPEEIKKKKKSATPAGKNIPFQASSGS